MQPWYIAIDKIVVQRDEGIEQVAIQTWEVNQGPDTIGHMVNVIQTLHIGQFVLWVKVHILEGSSTFPGHDCGLGRAVECSVIDRPIAGNQSDHKWHDGFPEAAYFHTVAMH